MAWEKSWPLEASCGRLRQVGESSFSALARRFFGFFPQHKLFLNTWVGFRRLRNFPILANLILRARLFPCNCFDFYAFATNVCSLIETYTLLSVALAFFEECFSFYIKTRILRRLSDDFY